MDLAVRPSGTALTPADTRSGPPEGISSQLVIHHPPGPQWRATITAIEDPGGLQDYLPDSDAVAWIRRDEGMIGIGEIARFEGDDADAAYEWWQQVSARIEVVTELPTVHATGPLVFASFVFDPSNTAHHSVLIVPRTILGRRDGESWLMQLSAIDATPDPAPQPLPDPPAPQPQQVQPNLDRPAWQGIVAEAVARIGTDGLEKVVLARSEVVQCAAPVNQRALVSGLSKDYRNCWTYAVDGLIGASPEMLVRLQGGLATSRVLAGTIRRNGAEELDLKLAHALARSSKNLIEHELAVASVASALAPFCSGMNVPDAPYVLELPNVLHLASDVTAVAHPGVSALQLAARLHPSAAVCGTPTPAARQLIAEVESLDRGRYSGPVGWMDVNGDGEFAIALRVGWIDPADRSRITIYAGCGIVAESDPVEEYAETEAKLIPLHGVLGLRQD